jgi:uncharacterized SAM-binding protein YcdF (DUF218 family)
VDFALSKLLEQFVIPSNFLLVAGLLGVLLSLIRRWRGRAARLTGLSLVLLAVCGWTSVGTMALAPLEDRFPLPHIVAPPTGIIMLGGAVDIHLTADRGQVTVNDAGERLTETAALAVRYPEARIFLSGGFGHVGQQGATPSEAAVARMFLLSVGIAADRIGMDEKSRTTCENAAETAKAIAPKPGETWLLVTSAWHMPRAMACFRAEKLDVTPYPVDFRSTAEQPWRSFRKSTPERLDNIDIAFHEWIGLLGYRVTGKTDELLPAPH